ncbi:indolepyruvate ferredoxin oxidoreductase family protein [Mycolicibacterium sp. S2-37]|uniref:indolepyruvate ferredoxin oxidoreductase family protein n=1 Tax=Mycolicibacterium sp. S2-37 TaxID=2810297 RepID=UPI001A94838D|nr:indolepyruvate ferredoxin oxidoreductase family protein [Mycolicibacterium sp. S2-37]MBO0676553.1 indolepyruvate ferredoxin oxidoreductase family protein [Mycolicibacterium sp. S2-37]
MTDLADNPCPAPYDLRSRYTSSSGPVLLTGVQAIARLMVEQHDRDRRAGRRVATFVSGYQGSPLAGLDRLLAGLGDVTSAHDIRLVPGVNEELAATAVWGSQLELPKGSRTHDGVVGFWYGKGPGLDRASDALRHAAMYGTHPAGGALALVGDDPAAKSSTVPAASERSLAALSMPVLFPRNAEEIVAFGLYGVALSRASGCWPALKIVADVADGLWTLDRDFADFSITVPTIEWDGRPWTYRQRVMAAPAASLLAEADLYGPRWAMVEAFAAANPIDTIETDPADAWLGIVAVGTAYDSVRQALSDLGLSEAALLQAGIRILRVGMPYPLGVGTVRRLAAGAEQVLVVEDKTGFVESQVKDALYGQDRAPSVLGKRDLGGRPLVPADGELTPARLTGPLRRVLSERMTVTAPPPPPSLSLTVLPTKRTAYFCSGCPHNRSTAVPAGSLAGGGIGCHTLVTMSSRTDSQVTGLTQMGGEGAQWIGQAPYTDVGHIFQNLGDGTYFHSGQLAVQANIAAGTNITYKILYNSAVAMTGAQQAEAGLSVPELTHKLAAEGVVKIIVCAEEPQRYRHASFAEGVTLWHRDRLDEAQRILRDTKGVTVLIYDQQCAAEARRKRKRGTLPVRRTRVVINEAVCEGCGDCGVKSNCLSVQPVDTEFGRKTRIDQTSCNTDYSCLDGRCPSFVTVEAPEHRPAARSSAPTPPPVSDVDIPRPVSPHNIFLAGIGGTGIVTVNQVLGMAALRAGLHVDGLDQTGLSQKAGPVTSHLRLSSEPAASNRISPGSADCILAFDLLTAAEAKNLGYGDPARTLTVASTSRTPTGEMVYDGSVSYPEDDDLLDLLRSQARSVVTLDALAAAHALFGDTAAANFLLIGAAYQAAALPVPAAAIEEAIEINGVAVQANQAAFRWGRVAVADPAAFRAASLATTSPRRSDTVVPTHLVAGSAVTGETRAIVERCAANLVAYQGDRLAARYIGAVDAVWAQERAVTSRTEFSSAVAANLHKLLAYKDEYEVARLLTDPAFVASLQTEVPGATKMTYLLHPPTMKALGRRKKIGFGPRSHGALKLLARGRFLRNTPFDPFGYAHVRKVERRLVAHYEAMVADLGAALTAASYDAAVAAASAPDIVRGYEEVKLHNVASYVARLNALGIDTTMLDN